MLTSKEIHDLADLATQMTNRILRISTEMRVNKIYLVGSYARGDQTDISDIDFLVELRNGTFPTWGQMREIHKLLPENMHVIFGTLNAQKSLKLPYKEL